MSDGAADYYVGLISGTSIDSLDAALVQFTGGRPRLLATHSETFPPALQHHLRRLATTNRISVNVLATTSRAFARLSALAAQRVIADAGFSARDIRAIGSHGQTIRHRPRGKAPFSMQIGDPATIAVTTGVVTIADFRSMDIAAGGEGAPLAPLFHAALAPAGETCAVVNIGGIANVSLIFPDEPLVAFDSGPGNCLIDAWMRRTHGETRDTDGALAARGHCDTRLLEALMTLDYFRQPAPKSTGVEVFNLDWIDSVLNTLPATPSDADVVATLTRLTALTIRDAITRGTGPVPRVYLCGGGAHNSTLRRELELALPQARVGDTTALGIGPDWVEAAAFAWLAKQRITGVALDTRPVTGADRLLQLGAIYALG